MHVINFATAPVPRMAARAAPAQHHLPAHLPALDGLRGVAILAVILYHYLANFGSTAPGLRELLGVIHSGWAGVDLFFVLSGFLITGILWDAKTPVQGLAVSAARFFGVFYARRMLRIFPLYYAVLAVALLVLPQLSPTPALQQLSEHKLSLFTYATNLDMGLHESFLFNAPPLYLGHFWSLAMEEQFYLVWPAVIYFLPRKGALGACLALIILAPMARIALAMQGGHEIGLYILPFCRVDALAFGAGAALLCRTENVAGITQLPTLKRAAVVTLVATSLVLLCLFVPTRELRNDSAHVLTFGLSCLALFFTAALILTLSASSASLAARLLTCRLLLVLGKYSYALYLFHLLLLPMYEHFFGVEILRTYLHSYSLAGVVFTVLATTASLAAARVSWLLLEAPCLSLKRHFPYAQAPGASLASHPVPQPRPI